MKKYCTICNRRFSTQDDEEDRCSTHSNRGSVRYYLRADDYGDNNSPSIYDDLGHDDLVGWDIGDA